MTRYQLSLNVENLPRGGIFRRPNPYAVVTVVGGPKEGGEIIGKTEAVMNTQDPEFTKVLFIETNPSIHYPIKVAIYNDRNDTLLAEARFEATEVFNSKGHVQEKTSDNGARIFVSIEESIKGDDKGTITLHIRGLDIKNVEPGPMGLGRSDPFFELSRKNADHASGIVRWNAIYRSKHINDHLNPMWKEFTLTLEELCYCDIDWPLKISVYDYEESGKHRLIGDFETTIPLLVDRVAIRGNADRHRAFEIMGEAKKSRLIKTRGLIVILKADLQLERNNNNDNNEQQRRQEESATTTNTNTPYHHTQQLLSPSMRTSNNNNNNNNTDSTSSPPNKPPRKPYMQMSSGATMKAENLSSPQVYTSTQSSSPSRRRTEYSTKNNDDDNNSPTTSPSRRKHHHHLEPTTSTSATTTQSQNINKPYIPTYSYNNNNDNSTMATMENNNNNASSSAPEVFTPMSHYRTEVESSSSSPTVSPSGRRRKQLEP